LAPTLGLEIKCGAPAGGKIKVLSPLAASAGISI